MNNVFLEIQELLQQRTDINARLKLLPYDGTPEIKVRGEGRYIYVRKRVANRLTSTYVDVYSDNLYSTLLRYAREAREFRKEIRHIDKRLAQLGYAAEELSEKVIQNVEFARINMKSNIYGQAVLEGVNASFSQIEDIIENGKISGVSATDVQKILNLKHAWEFVTDHDVIATKNDYDILCHIARLVNEGFFADGGRIRGVPVTISGTSYIPPIPLELEVKESISKIISESVEPIDVAVKLCLYCMKTQIFYDGNKRSAVIFANHFLIRNASGLLVISEKDVPEFKRLLVAYYEGRDEDKIVGFVKDKCWRKMILN